MLKLRHKTGEVDTSIFKKDMLDVITKEYYMIENQMSSFENDQSIIKVDCAMRSLDGIPYELDSFYLRSCYEPNIVKDHNFIVFFKARWLWDDFLIELIEKFKHVDTIYLHLNEGTFKDHFDFLKRLNDLEINDINVVRFINWNEEISGASIIETTNSLQNLRFIIRRPSYCMSSDKILTELSTELTNFNFQYER